MWLSLLERRGWRTLHGSVAASEAGTRQSVPVSAFVEPDFVTNVLLARHVKTHVPLQGSAGSGRVLYCFCF